MILVVVHADAQEEILSAANHYEAKAPSQGREFLNAVERGLALLAENPYYGPKIRHNARRLVLQAFPYYLVYRILPDYVLVIAAAHHRRRFGYGRKRT